MVAIQDKQLPKEVILAQGGAPSNGELWIKYVKSLVDVLNAKYLLYSEFNRVTKKIPTDDPIEQLRRQQRDEQRIKQEQNAVNKSDDKTAKKTQSTALSIDDDEEKLDDSLRTSYAMSMTESTVVSSMSVDDDESEVYFLDPLTKAVENSDKRSLRAFVFDIVSRSMIHYDHLVEQCSVGDVASLFAFGKDLSQKQDFPALLSALTSMTSLRKDPSMSWSKFSTSVLNIRKVFRNVKDKQLQIHDKVLALTVLHAMDGDSRYAVEVGMLRRMSPPPDLDRILAELTAISNRPGFRSISGHSADVSTASNVLVGNAAQFRGRRAGKTNFCFKFAATGSCPKGDNCKYSHDIERNGVCPYCYKPHDFVDCPQRAADLRAADEKRSKSSSSSTKSSSSSVKSSSPTTSSDPHLKAALARIAALEERAEQTFPADPALAAVAGSAAPQPSGPATSGSGPAASGHVQQ